MGLFARVALVIRELLAYLLILTGIALALGKLFVPHFDVSDVVLLVYPVIAALLLGFDISVERLIDRFPWPVVVERNERDQVNGNGN